MNKTASYNRLVTFCVIIVETLLCGGLFYLYTELAKETFWLKHITASRTQVILSLMLVYYICASATGVVLYRRKVYAYEILNKVTISTTGFAILSYLVLKTSRYMDMWSLMYFNYLISVYFAIIAFRLLLRFLIKRYRTRGGNLRHVVLVGGGRSMGDLYASLTDQKWAGLIVNGYFDYHKDDNMPEGCKYLGVPDEALGYLAENKEVNYLYCGLRDKHKDDITRIISFCENNLVRFYSVPNLNNYLQNKVYAGFVGDTIVLSLRRDNMSRLGNKVLKRTFDIVFSGLFLVTLFPVILVVVSIITKITMPGPIFFKQKRNGLNDKEFYCYKFRSMKVNADADKVQATKDDPRKTRWGNIMRKTNIDELPQFINVFMGDMSVVGPRPHMLKHTEEYSRLINKYMVRHFVKPGVTGWSQVTGFRGETKELKDMEGRIKGDIWYIENWSFWLDLYIIYRTVANVVKGEDKAY